MAVFFFTVIVSDAVVGECRRLAGIIHKINSSEITYPFFTQDKNIGLIGTRVNSIQPIVVLDNDALLGLDVPRCYSKSGADRTSLALLTL